jgi:hypothetical protein
MQVLTMAPCPPSQVRPHHSQLIYDAYAGDKNLVKFSGDHNDVRPGFFNDSACIFLKQVLLIPEELALHGVPVDRDNRPMHIGYAFHAAANGGGSTRYNGGMGRAHQLEAQRLVMAQRLAMMREQEDAMLMQAIAASLEDGRSGGGPRDGAHIGAREPVSDPPPAAAQDDAKPQSEAQGIPRPPTAPPLEPLAAAVPGGDDDEDEALMREAIRLSLEAAPP